MIGTEVDSAGKILRVYVLVHDFKTAGTLKLEVDECRKRTAGGDSVDET